MKTWIFAWAIGLISAAMVWPDAPPQTKKVLIIGVDGTMPSALAVANTPTLNALRAGGAFSDRAITDPVTHSAACWSSMFTGVWGDKHGVNDPGNSFTGNRFDLYPNFMRRLEMVDSNLNTVAYLRWAPLQTALAGTDIVQAFDSDAALVSSTCSLLTNANPDVFYTILLDVDSAGHSYGWGPTVTNYVKAIQTADARVGQIINALTNRATYAQEDWLVIVLSDHGEHDSSLERSRVTFHLVWGPTAAQGVMYPTPSIVDVCPTVLHHLGVPIDPAWNLDARLEGLPLPPARYGTNLVVNGDAETNSGTNGYTPNRGIAWWWDHNSVTLACYGAHPSFPGTNSPGPAQRGHNFFLGGTNTALVSQTIDVANLAGDIDGAQVDYLLSGWLGGADLQEDSARFIARFLDDSGALVYSASVEPVTAAQRGGVTGLLERSVAGTLPQGTRRVEFVLLAQAVSGANDASADNLSFVLTRKPDPPFRVLIPEQTDQGWLVRWESLTNRVYELERSEDLLEWHLVSPAVPGTGAPLSLVDTNAPFGQGFYRVRVCKDLAL
jgi:hypothetical protein